ncbi:hypothetical protein [Chitinophaga filiformis]|nr:hypothetical protein [Chitinophaga filiformis]
MKNMKQYGTTAIAILLLLAIFAAALFEFTSAGQKAATSCIVGAP